MCNPARTPGLIQRYRELLQTRHYARRTVKTYEQWLRRFLRFHRLRHPREMGSQEVNDFLSHLAVEEQVSASTQNQALAALLFLYRDLLERDLELRGWCVSAWRGSRRWWWGCSTAVACGSWRPCGSGSRIWISNGESSRCEMARAARIG